MTVFALKNEVGENGKNFKSVFGVEKEVNGISLDEGI